VEVEPTNGWGLEGRERLAGFGLEEGEQLHCAHNHHQHLAGEEVGTLASGGTRRNDNQREEGGGGGGGQ
jgi:hypothetical protein